MPVELVAKMKRANTFDQGFDTLEYLAAALVDMEWNALPASAPLQNPVAFEQAALKKHGIQLDAFWFPANLGPDSRTILDTLKRHQIKTQLWITMSDPEGNEFDIGQS